MAKNKDFEEYRRQQQEMLELNQKMRGSLKDQMSYYGDLYKLTVSLNHSKRQLVRMEEELKRLSKSTNKEDQKRAARLKAEIGYQAQLIKEEQKKLELMKKQATVSNLLAASLNSAWKGVKDNFKYFIEQDKAIKMSALSMGVLNKQSRGYWDNITKSALQTNILGASAADLAKMQANYSEELGRMVVLSEEGNVAMAQMAKGTMLGEEGAAAMAASMDTFAISATGARDKVQETVDLAHKMGLNASKVLKNLQNNLKIAQTHNFKGGVTGMIKMTAYAEKFKINMESIAGFADKLFSPEGAVEAAAQLQVLGGAWSRLADPFTLMYNARNDMEGLTQSIVEATAGTFKFNKATGEITKSALELHRLQEVAKATGLDFNMLAESAHKMAMYKAIDLDIRPSITGDAKELVESMATYDKKKKAFVINIGAGPDGTKMVKDLTDIQLKQFMAEKNTLEERAKSSQTFDEQWTNIVNTFKTALLPFMKEVADGISGVLAKFLSWAKTSQAFETIARVGKSLGEKIGAMIEYVGSFVIDHPVKAAIGAVLGLGLFEVGKWALMGASFGMGFMKVAQLSGGMSGILGGPAGTPWMGAGNGAPFGMTPSGSLGSNFAAAKGSNMLKFGGAIAGLTSAFSEFNKNQENGMGTGENAVKSGTKGLTTGAGTWLGAAGAGALAGSVFPGIGTIGGFIVGALGGLAGGYLGSKGGDLINSGWGQQNSQANDYIYSSQNGVTPIDSEDTATKFIMGHKAGGPGEKAMSNASSSSNMSGNVHVTFDVIKFEFAPLQLQFANGQGIGELVMNDMNASASLTSKLNESLKDQIAKVIGGGKYNANTFA